VAKKRYTFDTTTCKSCETEFKPEEGKPFAHAGLPVRVSPLAEGNFLGFRRFVFPKKFKQHLKTTIMDRQSFQVLLEFGLFDPGI